MLTPNFSKIISVILEQSRNHTLEQRPAEELRSIGLMLLGYLRLIRTDFTTPADSTEPSEGYYADLKNVLNLITTSQTNRLNAIKKQLVIALNSDLRSLVKEIEALDTQTNLDKKTQYHIGLLKKSMLDLTVRIEQTMPLPGVGLIESMQLLIQEQASLSEQMKRIPPPNFATMHHLVQKTTAHHLKDWAQWIEIEQNNQQCITYASCGELIDLCL